MNVVYKKEQKEGIILFDFLAHLECNDLLSPSWSQRGKDGHVIIMVLTPTAKRPVVRKRCIQVYSFLGKLLCNMLAKDGGVYVILKSALIKGAFLIFVSLHSICIHVSYVYTLG